MKTYYATIVITLEAENHDSAFEKAQALADKIEGVPEVEVTEVEEAEE
jgi:translation elongation factor EF-1beta